MGGLRNVGQESRLHSKYDGTHSARDDETVAEMFVCTWDAQAAGTL